MVCRECSFRKGRLCWSCGKCTSSCILYEKYICPRLSRPPYVCNGCPSRNKCSLENISISFLCSKEYELVRSESRAGFALSPTELKQMDDIVSPLLIKGQSLHHIAVHHADELMKSERTLYAYVNNGLFTARNLDMPRTVRMRPRKMFPEISRWTRPAVKGVIFPVSRPIQKNIRISPFVRLIL